MHANIQNSRENVHDFHTSKRVHLNTASRLQAFSFFSPPYPTMQRLQKSKSSDQGQRSTNLND